MAANETRYVACNNGFFVLPDETFLSLSEQATKGFVYVREDEDALTIAATRLVDGRRRALANPYRAPMFRGATRLAVIDLKDSLRVMAVEWK